MAGHSKWKQIKHYKAATDAKRGAHFTKLIREITMAAKLGGGDPAGNPRLRTAIDAAKAASMPKDNIERAIKKGTGELEGVDYHRDHLRGLRTRRSRDPDLRADATIRIAPSPRSGTSSRALGGNLGAANSVSWMFERKGQIYLDASDATTKTRCWRPRSRRARRISRRRASSTS